jgi:hypothetical protein
MPYLDLANVELAFGLLEQTLLPRGHWLVERGAAGQRAVQPDGGALARSSEEARAVGASTEGDARMIAVTFLTLHLWCKNLQAALNVGCGAPIRVHYFVSNAARTKETRRYSSRALRRELRLEASVT